MRDILPFLLKHGYAVLFLSVLAEQAGVPIPSTPFLLWAGALAGLGRWKARHPEAAKYIAVEDVLVDSMRGRSSTWTRIRVNLRHVPEGLRPPQETPDPDDDPTREWRRR